ncbi:MAG: hypothetical protein ACXWV5_08360 [Flavitalea sp.]
MVRFTIFFLLLFLVSFHSQAQNFDSLGSISKSAFKIHYSDGQESRAEKIGGRVQNALGYYRLMLNFNPSFTMLVLSADDWKKYTTLPVIYGMPHYNPENKTLVVAAEDNPFWKSFIPPMDKLPGDLAAKINSAYKDENGNVSMREFFDLLALHELGHTFHIQKGINVQRMWMGELFCNILLHTYIAEKEPAALPALTVFPEMVIAAGTEGYKYTSLSDVHERYDEIGSKYPNNYGWYQSRWHNGAGKIYDAAGKSIGRKLWDGFASEQKILNDEEMLKLLSGSGAGEVAEFIRNWDKNMVR